MTPHAGAELAALPQRRVHLLPPFGRKGEGAPPFGGRGGEGATSFGGRRDKIIKRPRGRNFIWCRRHRKLSGRTPNPNYKEEPRFRTKSGYKGVTGRHCPGHSVSRKSGAFRCRMIFLRRGVRIASLPSSDEIKGYHSTSEKGHGGDEGEKQNPKHDSTKHKKPPFESFRERAPPSFRKSQPIISSDFTIHDFPHVIQSAAGCVSSGHASFGPTPSCETANRFSDLL